MRLDHLLPHGGREKKKSAGCTRGMRRRLSSESFFNIDLSGELAQLARASALQAEGQGFEPPILHKPARSVCGRFFESREGKEEGL